MTTDEINTIIQLFDTNNDGNINYAEFSQGCVAMAQQIARLAPTTAYREQQDAKRQGKIKPKPKPKTSKRPTKARVSSKAQSRLSGVAPASKPQSPSQSRKVPAGKPQSPTVPVDKTQSPPQSYHPERGPKTPDGRMALAPLPSQAKEVKVLHL
jgi:hypothetical protein